MSILDFIKSQDSRPETMNVTPHWISELKDDEIFVFGCRRSGRHYEGAANFARENFGAIVGQGEGLQGQSYAIPTAGVGLDWIRQAVERFTEFASANPNLKFLVTPVGCGLGLWRYEEIAPLFREAPKLPNVWLPEEFWNELNKNQTRIR